MASINASLSPMAPSATTLHAARPASRVIAIASGKGGVGKTTVAAGLAVVTLVLGAMTVFGELRSSLNTIWAVEGKPRNGMLGLLLDRLMALLMVIVIGAVLLLSDLAELLGLRPRGLLEEAFARNGLEVVARHDAKARHGKAKDRADPLYEVRSREVTSLYVLGARPGRVKA